MALTDEPRAGVTQPAQPTAPYLDAVWGYAFRGSTRFHVPGHKGGAGADPGLRSALGETALMVDVPADIHGIDLGPAPTPYQRAEALAAEAHGAARSWFLTNGASQGNHALCLAQAPLGAAVVVQRNSHASVVDGLVLSGGVPTYVAPEYDHELGMAHGVTPESLEAAIAKAGAPRGVFIVSPTYYGMAADVAACAAVCHAADVPLIVDQAWGPHFGFHPDLPHSALQLGADAVLTSTHKIVGSLTQSAMLHVAPGGRVDPDKLARMVRLTRSTSPSALLMSSLDAARRQLAVHGETLLERTMAAGDEARAVIDRVPGVRVIGDEFVGLPGVAGWDPMRIVIDVRATGCTGYEVAAALREGFDIHVELATNATMVLILGLGQRPEDLERFAHDFGVVVERIARPGETAALVRAAGALENEVVVPPREAFLGESVAVPVQDAIGRVSAESIAGYPPGIPALLPGERITTELVDYLRELKDSGARLHGASDPRFRTIFVLSA
jgi:arginine decarboxylase